MKVVLRKYSVYGGDYDVMDSVTCTLNGAEVEVRQASDGTYMIVVIRNGFDNNVRMQSRPAAIWIEVKPEDR